ncbi:PAS domain-containing protein [Haloparvum sp. PAK95]|uniref:PAS domain-containing protein n=1 Tax=Haloparvum sp. PAK95 TaxID=3418962 RepID=UPI003D2F0939
MAPDGVETGSPATAGDDQTPDDEPRILLLMDAGRNRTLLAEVLEEVYRVEATSDQDRLDGAFDCCIVGERRFADAAETVRSRRETAAEVFLPFVLLVREETRESAPADVWDYVDDVIEMPVEQAELSARIDNLVERRLTSVELAEREEQLAETVEELQLKERAIDEAPVGLTIADPDGGNNPVVYANAEFETLTGYEESDILGRDCRFLQGEETSDEPRRRLRTAIDAEESVSVDIVNYRKNGRKFWNKVDVAPIRNADGEVTNYVGFQADITDRKIRERRLEVLNRVLSHNLRNKMNVIEGYVALLNDEFGADERPLSLVKIDEAAEDVIGLADTVRDIERTLSGPSETVVALDRVMEQLVSAFDDRYPEATFRLSLPSEGDCDVAVTGIVSAIEEAVENAVEHNDSPEPTVEIRVVRRSEDWIDVEIEDDGPGIPEQEISVLREGETSLVHADRLGLWMIYWVVSKAGGIFDVERIESGGTLLTLRIPAHR